MFVCKKSEYKIEGIDVDFLEFLVLYCDFFLLLCLDVKNFFFFLRNGCQENKKLIFLLFKLLL